jgi:hypothetical protein
MQAKELHHDEKQKEDHRQTGSKEILFFLPDPYLASGGKDLRRERGQ